MKEGFPENRIEDAIDFLKRYYGRLGFSVESPEVRWADLYVVSIDYILIHEDGLGFPENDEVDVSGPECVHYRRADPMDDFGGFGPNFGC